MKRMLERVILGGRGGGSPVLWGARGEGTELWCMCDGEDMEVEVPRICPESVQQVCSRVSLQKTPGITKVGVVDKAGAARSLVLCGVWNGVDGWTPTWRKGV